jgi:hypothetical protein
MADGNILVCRCTSTFGSTVGNITGIVKDFIERLFPPGFFKGYFIDTKFLSKEVEEGEIYKKKKPTLVIRPRPIIDDSTIFGILPDWYDTNHFIYKNLKNNYYPVLANTDNKAFIYSVPDRIKISFEIEIILPSKIQQLNTAYFFKGAISQKAYFYLDNVYLETEVPRYFIKTLSQKLDYDLNNNEEELEFEEYLKKHSLGYITRKTKLSSGVQCYFYKYSANILSIFEDYPQIDDGKEKGQISDDFKITNTLTTELWVPNQYFLEVGNDSGELQLPVYDEDITNQEFLMNFTFNTEPREEIGDYKRVIWQGYITDKGVAVDELDISTLINNQLKAVIDYYLKYSLDMSLVVLPKLFRNWEEIPPEKYEVNWEDLILRNIEPEEEKTYHFGLYARFDKVNEILIRLGIK